MRRVACCISHVNGVHYIDEYKRLVNGEYGAHVDFFIVNVSHVRSKYKTLTGMVYSNNEKVKHELTEMMTYDQCIYINASTDCHYGSVLNNEVIQLGYLNLSDSAKFSNICECIRILPYISDFNCIGSEENLLTYYKRLLTD